MTNFTLAALIEFGICLFDARRTYLNRIAGL